MTGIENQGPSENVLQHWIMPSVPSSRSTWESFNHRGWELGWDLFITALPNEKLPCIYYLIYLSDF